MKYSRSSDLATRLDGLLARVVQLADDEHLENLTAYLETFTNKIWTTLRHVMPERVEAFMNSVRQQGFNQGVSQGFSQGVSQGVSQGKAGLLEELLQQRFGQLQPDLLARIRSADSGLLSIWGRRLLTAPDLQSIFR